MTRAGSTAPVAGRPRFAATAGRREMEGKARVPAAGPRTDQDVTREADRLVLARAPAGVGVDESMIILRFRCDTLGGERTYELLRQRREDVRVLLMSGPSERDAVPQLVSRDLAGFLRKPFGRSHLVARLEEVLVAE